MFHLRSAISSQPFKYFSYTMRKRNGRCEVFLFGAGEDRALQRYQSLATQCPHWAVGALEVKWAHCSASRV